MLAAKGSSVAGTNSNNAAGKRRRARNSHSAASTNAQVRPDALVTRTLGCDLDHELLRAQLQRPRVGDRGRRQQRQQEGGARKCCLAQRHPQSLRQPPDEKCDQPQHRGSGDEAGARARLPHDHPRWQQRREPGPDGERDHAQPERHHRARVAHRNGAAAEQQAADRRSARRSWRREGESRGRSGAKNRRRCSPAPACASRGATRPAARLRRAAPRRPASPRPRDGAAASTTRVARQRTNRCRMRCPTPAPR